MVAARLPARVFRVAKTLDVWRRRQLPDDPEPKSNRYDDPMNQYRTIYAASTRYGAFLAELAEFRPSRVIDLASSIERNEDLVETPEAGDVQGMIARRFIGEARLRGRFADLTKFDADLVTFAERDRTQQLSRAIFELEEPRFDGLCYSSRFAGIVRWAIFERSVEADGGPITDDYAERIDLRDPDLIRALTALELKASSRD